MRILKFIMRLIESIFKSSMILILIALILLSTLDFIPNRDYKFLTEVISVALFGVFYLYQAYKDINNKQYITYQYINITDLVILLSFTLICYLSFKHYENTDAIIIGHSYVRWSVIVIGIADLIRNYLRNEKFIKNKL